MQLLFVFDVLMQALLYICVVALLSCLKGQPSLWASSCCCFAGQDVERLLSLTCAARGGG